MTAAKTPRPKHRTSSVFQEPTMNAEGFPADVPKKRQGRPSKMTPAIRKGIVAAITTGAPIEHCAGSLGVSRSVVYDWLARGQADEAHGKPTEFAAFFRDIARARAEWWVATYGKISLGEEGWKGRAWLAERLDRNRLAPPTNRQEITGAGGGAIKIEPMTVRLPVEVDHRGLPILAAGASGASSKASTGADPEAAGARGNGALHPEKHVNGANGKDPRSNGS